MTSILIILVVLFALFVYFLPTIIAYNRSVKGTMWIFVLNTFLAGTVVVYIVLLIWACTGAKQNEEYE